MRLWVGAHWQSPVSHRDCAHFVPPLFSTFGSAIESANRLELAAHVRRVPPSIFLLPFAPEASVFGELLLRGSKKLFQRGIDRSLRGRAPPKLFIGPFNARDRAGVVAASHESCGLLEPHLKLLFRRAVHRHTSLRASIAVTCGGGCFAVTRLDVRWSGRPRAIGGPSEAR